MTRLEPLAGIVLCGGASARMGMAKALLPFGSETLLGRVSRQLRAVATPVVVVAAPEQTLPDLPSEIEIYRDRQAGAGPLEGLRVGLAALARRAEVAYLTGCDCPLLVPSFVRRLYDLLGEHEIAMPEIDGVLQPLAAVYRVSLLQRIDPLLAQRNVGPITLARIASTRFVSGDDLRSVDPTLDSLVDVDGPIAYQAALIRAGFAAAS